jgi:hypothetical protein
MFLLLCCILFSLCFHFNLFLQAKRIGVFSCGPPPMTLQVEKAKTAVNKFENFPTYSAKQHQFIDFSKLFSQLSTVNHGIN